LLVKELRELAVSLGLSIIGVKKDVNERILMKLFSTVALPPALSNERMNEGMITAVNEYFFKKGLGRPFAYHSDRAQSDALVQGSSLFAQVPLPPLPAGFLMKERLGPIVCFFQMPSVDLNVYAPCKFTFITDFMVPVNFSVSHRVLLMVSKLKTDPQERCAPQTISSSRLAHIREFRCSINGKYV